MSFLRTGAMSDSPIVAAQCMFCWVDHRVWDHNQSVNINALLITKENWSSLSEDTTCTVERWPTETQGVLGGWCGSPWGSTSSGQHLHHEVPSASVSADGMETLLCLSAFYHLRSNRCKEQKLSSTDDRWSPQMKTKSAGYPPSSDTQSNLEQWPTEDSLHPCRHPESCFLPWPLTGVAARGMKCSVISDLPWTRAMANNYL